MAINDHFGIQPSVVTSAILSELSVLKKLNGGAGGGGTGVLATIKRIPGATFPDALIDGFCQAGLPAMLVSYEGGAFSTRSNRRDFSQTMQFRIICIAGEMTSVSKRLDDDISVNPGIEELLDLATYYGMHAIDDLDARSATPVGHQWVSVAPGRYIASVDFTVIRKFDTWGDAPANTFEKLGIVHEPLDPDDLWEIDNTTPKSYYPRTTDGGVSEMT